MVLTRRRRCNDLKNPRPTCYTKQQLLDLVSIWNNKSNIDKIDNITSLSKNELWIELRKRYNTVHEDLWLKDVKKTRKKKYIESFAPLVPKEWNNNPNQWLSDEDLFKAMKAYEKKYKKFLFLYPAPIDFDEKDNMGNCAWSNLCKYTYSSLSRNYNEFGAIFNTHPHNKPGQHWISLFVNLKKGDIYYFDSVGDDPPEEVINLINRFKKEGDIYFKNKGKLKKVSVTINKLQHQEGNTECGVYSLFFIHHMLTDGDFSKLSKNRITDDQITKFRGYFFDDIYEIYS